MLEDDILCPIVRASFEAPHKVSKLLEQLLSRNRQLNSSLRRELTSVIYDSLRWRRRLWEECPETVSFFDTKERILEIKRWAYTVSESPQKISDNDLGKLVSFPTWIIELWNKHYRTDEVFDLALSMNQEADVCLRVDISKISRLELQKKLSQEGVETSLGELASTALYVKDRKNIRGTESFKKGYFDIQDESSQLAVEMARVKEGMKVLDACARSGGKTLAMAARMKNKGHILACDIDTRVLEELNRRAARLKTSCVQTQWVGRDDPNPLGYLKVNFDVVLVDAPCSGLGVFRRNPHSKWVLTKEKLDEYASTQIPILKKYAQYVKPKGRLIYSTCTLNPQENQEVVQTFLKSNPDFSLEQMRELRPSIYGTDGFFVSCLCKDS